MCSYGKFSHFLTCLAWLDGNVGGLAGRLKYLIKCSTELHEILYRHVWYPQDES